MIIIAFVLIALFALFTYRKQAAELERLWKSLAAERGLQWRPGGLLSYPQLVGEHRSYAVTITITSRSQGKSKIPYTTVTVSPQRPLPPQLRITQEDFMDAMSKMLGGQDITIGDDLLDPQLRFRSSDPAGTRALFADPELRQAIGSLSNGCPYSRLESEQVVLETRGRLSADLGEMLDDTIMMAAALDDARIRPWQDIASRLALVLSDSRRRVTLTGSHRGRQVFLSVNFAANRTIIDVPVTGLPAQLTITKGDKLDAIQLGDPILDGTLSVTGSDPEAIRALLRDDTLRGELLAVLHAWPGSQLTPKGVQLVMPGAAAVDLEARLEETTALASTLARRLAQRHARGGERQPVSS